MPARLSNYLLKMHMLAQQGILKKGEAYDLTWLHDEWCEFWTPDGVCNCDPDVEIKLLDDAV